MSPVSMTAPPAAAKAPRARTPMTESVPTPTPTLPTHGSTAADPDRRRGPLLTAVRNVGIVLDTAARVVFLGRDGVKL